MLKNLRFDLEDEENDLRIILSHTNGRFRNTSPQPPNIEASKTHLPERLERTLRRIHKELIFPGQSFSLLHACIKSIIEVLEASLTVDHSCQKGVCFISVYDRRLKYIHALVHGDRFLKSAGFSWDSQAQAWRIPIVSAAKFSYVYKLLEDTLVSLREKQELSNSVETLGENIIDPIYAQAGHPKVRKVIGCFLGALLGDLLGSPVDGWDKDTIHSWFHYIQDIHALPPASALSDEEWEKMSFQNTLGVYSAESSFFLSLAHEILHDESSLHSREIIRIMARKIVCDRPRTQIRVFQQLFSRYLSLKNSDNEKVTNVAIKESESFLETSDISFRPIGPNMILPLAFFLVDGDNFTIIERLLEPLADMQATVISYLHFQSLRYLFEHCTTPESFCFEQFISYLTDSLSLVPLEFRAISAKIKHVIQKEKQNGENEQQDDIVQTYSRALNFFRAHFKSPKLCILEAVNSTCSAQRFTAMLLGSIMGLLHGYSWIPVSWFKCLSNRRMSEVEGISRDEIIRLASNLYQKSHQTHI